eukprot:scaffold204808_cov29-Tisochrysis_lutea.AAC.3
MRVDAQRQVGGHVQIGSSPSTATTSIGPWPRLLQKSSYSTWLTVYTCWDHAVTPPPPSCDSLDRNGLYAHQSDAEEPPPFLDLCVKVLEPISTDAAWWWSDRCPPASTYFPRVAAIGAFPQPALPALAYEVCRRSHCHPHRACPPPHALRPACADVVAETASSCERGASTPQTPEPQTLGPPLWQSRAACTVRWCIQQATFERIECSRQIACSWTGSQSLSPAELAQVQPAALPGRGLAGAAVAALGGTSLAEARDLGGGRQPARATRTQGGECAPICARGCCWRLRLLARRKRRVKLLVCLKLRLRLGRLSRHTSLAQLEWPRVWRQAARASHA